MLPIMRTISEAHAMLLADDPQCALTKGALRRLVTIGEIPSVIIGKRRRLLDYSLLIAYLKNPPVEPKVKLSKAGEIRQVF